MSARPLFVLALLVAACSRRETPTIASDDDAKSHHAISFSKPRGSIVINEWKDLGPRLEPCIPAVALWYPVRVAYRPDGTIEFETCEANEEVARCMAAVLEQVACASKPEVPADMLFLSRQLHQMGPPAFGPVRILPMREMIQEDGFGIDGACNYLVYPGSKYKSPKP